MLRLLTAGESHGPALSVVVDGLPAGLQLVGRPFDESTLLRLGHAYEHATAWHRRRPALP